MIVVDVAMELLLWNYYDVAMELLLWNCCYGVVAAVIGEVVVEVGATCGCPGHHGIEARRRA